MRPCMIFIGKEIREHIRTYRLLIIAIVFILFGIMSPATAKLTPEIIRLVTDSSGVTLSMPPVTVQDSYMQFFKNMDGIGIIILLLVFASLVAGEKAKGSAQLILTKNLPRPAFVVAKYCAAALVWTVTYAASALVCQGYTLWLFPGDAVSNLFLSFAAYWLYGLLLITFTVLASSVAHGYGIAALGAFAGWGLLMLSNIPAKVARYSPAALGSLNLQLISGAKPPADLLVPAILAVALILVSLAAASWALSRQEL